MLRFRHIKKREIFHRGLGDRSWCELSRGGVAPPPVVSFVRKGNVSFMVAVQRIIRTIRHCMGSPLKKFLDPPLVGAID